MEEIIASIGPKVGQLRQQKRLSLQQLAERSGVSAAAIHKIERNGMVPTITTLMKLAAALNRSVAYFVEEEEHEDRPAWMGKVGFSDLKIKLIGAIVAISAVELLKAFINVDQFTWQQLGWKVGIHVAFVVSGVLFAITDRITEGKTGGH